MCAADAIIRPFDDLVAPLEHLASLAVASEPALHNTAFQRGGCEYSKNTWKSSDCRWLFADGKEGLAAQSDFLGTDLATAAWASADRLLTCLCFRAWRLVVPQRMRPSPPSLESWSTFSLPSSILAASSPSAGNVTFGSTPQKRSPATVTSCSPPWRSISPCSAAGATPSSASSCSAFLLAAMGADRIGGLGYARKCCLRRYLGAWHVAAESAAKRRAVAETLTLRSELEMLHDRSHVPRQGTLHALRLCQETWNNEEMCKRWAWAVWETHVAGSRGHKRCAVLHATLKDLQQIASTDLLLGECLHHWALVAREERWEMERQALKLEIEALKAQLDLLNTHFEAHQEESAFAAEDIATQGMSSRSFEGMRFCAHDHLEHAHYLPGESIPSSPEKQSRCYFPLEDLLLGASPTNAVTSSTKLTPVQDSVVQASENSGTDLFCEGRCEQKVSDQSIADASESDTPTDADRESQELTEDFENAVETLKTNASQMISQVKTQMQEALVQASYQWAMTQQLIAQVRCSTITRCGKMEDTWLQAAIFMNWRQKSIKLRSAGKNAELRTKVQGLLSWKAHMCQERTINALNIVVCRHRCSEVEPGLISWLMLIWCLVTKSSKQANATVSHVANLEDSNMQWVILFKWHGYCMHARELKLISADEPAQPCSDADFSLETEVTVNMNSLSASSSSPALTAPTEVGSSVMRRRLSRMSSTPQLQETPEQKLDRLVQERVRAFMPSDPPTIQLVAPNKYKIGGKYMLAVQLKANDQVLARKGPAWIPLERALPEILAACSNMPSQAMPVPHNAASTAVSANAPASVAPGISRAAVSKASPAGPVPHRPRVPAVAGMVAGGIAKASARTPRR